MALRILPSKSRNIRLHVRINDQNFFDQPLHYDIKTYETFEKMSQTWKMTIQQDACLIIHTSKKTLQDDCISEQTTGRRCYSKSNTTNQFYRKSRASMRYTNVILILEEFKETVLDLLQRTVKVM